MNKLTASLVALSTTFSATTNTAIQARINQVDLYAPEAIVSDIVLEEDIQLTIESDEHIGQVLADALIEPEPEPVKLASAQIVQPTAPVVRPPAPVKQDVEPFIQQYAGEYGLSADKLRAIGFCESGLRPEALSSNGLYGGIFQFVSSTWVSNRNAMGLDPDPNLRFNAEENIRTAAFKMSRDGYGAWPVCGKRG